MVKTGFFAFFLLLSVCGRAQTYPVNGQLPETAFPVCGTINFVQTTVPQGFGGNLEVPGCGSYPAQNPFWYTFTCYKSGSLGFLLTPNDLGDDYDWQLYDITGHQPKDVFSNVGLVVTGNWVGTYGLTGARNGGSAQVLCGSNPADNITAFSSMPTLIKGHVYLLLISHYTESQSGYTLSFNGGTASITDTTTAHLKSASVVCDRKSIIVVLKKQMRCNSLAADGSDFMLPSNPGSIASAQGINCGNGFDMDSILLTLNTTLAPGNYQVQSKTGSDGNTLLDDCGQTLPKNESVPFEVQLPVPTPFDSLTTPACAPQTVQLVFADPMQCSSIAPDGSDFTVTGSPAIQILKAEGVCTNGYSRVVNITFTAAVVLQGSYQISLVAGTDGNSIINICGAETPSGGVLAFNTLDTVSADFNYTILWGCKTDTIAFAYSIANGVNEWNWMIDSIPVSRAIAPSIPETVFSPKIVQHIVTNGFCSDTVTKTVNLDNYMKADFQSPDIFCPKEAVSFSNLSIGKIVRWNWNFGDDTYSDKNEPPPHLFPLTVRGQNYLVSLVIENNLGCLDTLSKQVTKLQSCYITVPNAFSPDGNGVNDYLYPLNAYKATHLEFRVFNRFGQLVFETSDWTKRWDGTINGRAQPVGTYVWTLRYTDSDSGKTFSTRGTSVLIR